MLRDDSTGDTSERRSYVLPINEASRGLVEHVLEITARDVVYVKSLVEASEGLASIFGESGGRLTIATPRERSGALEQLLSDVVEEIDARWRTRPETFLHAAPARPEGPAVEGAPSTVEPGGA